MGNLFSASIPSDASSHWVGPYGIFIPNTIGCVPDIDDHNRLFKDGKRTNIQCAGSLLSKESYIEKYAILKSGFYYWKPILGELDTSDYWNGPYDILVPNNIREVIATDGSNKVDKNGSETEKVPRSAIPSAFEYKVKYTEMGPDGNFYWKP